MAITADIIEGLDWNQEWSAVASGVSNAYISNSINYGIDFNNSEAVMGDMNWDSLGYSIGVSLVMSELGIGQSEEGQIGATIGTIWGPVGTFIGGAIGDLFSSPPTATSIWHYNPLTGEAHEVYGDADDGRVIRRHAQHC